MANHYYFVGRDMPTAELCLFRGGVTAVQQRRASINEISPYTSQIEKAEFVTKVQPTTKVFDHCMN